MGKRKRAVIEETDVDNFREIWESDEHWEMRKCFILKNQHVHDEDKLKCLSQLYYNIKILGCTYSPEVMKKMDKLIDDCPKPKPKKPCFVKAESAQPTENINTSQNITSSKYAIPRRNAASFFVSESKNIPEQPVVLNRIQPMVVYDESVNPNQQIPRKQTVEMPFFAPERKNLIEKSINVNGIQPMIVYDETINPKHEQIIRKPTQEFKCKTTTRSDLNEKLAQIKETIEQYPQQVTNASQLLGIALPKCHISVDWKFQCAPDSKRHEPTFECECILQDFTISKGIGRNKKSAKNDACQKLIDKLASDEWMQNIIPIKSARKTKIVPNKRISGVIKSSNGENGEPVYTVVPPPQPELITTVNLDMNNTNIIPNVNVNTFADTNVSPNVIAEANGVESVNAKDIDLVNITKVLNKNRLKYSYPVALVECVVKQCHYQFEWKISLISDTKPTNDFNYFCEFVVNGNCVSVGRGKKQKCAKVMAAERFINKLDTKEKKRALAVRVNESIPPKVSTNFFQFMNFVIVELPNACELGDVQILRHSASFNKKKVVFSFNESCCNVTLDSKLIASAKAVAGGRSTAKAKAAKLALIYLRQMCYTVKIKSVVASNTKISKDDVKPGAKCAEPPAALSDSNVGNKLLRLMGWTGGGLGKHGTGIEEPIKCATIIRRRGIGMDDMDKSAHVFRRRVHKIILNYASSGDDNDLVFTSEFSKIERAEMHRIALKYGLKSNSRCKGDKRHLVLSRKYTPQTLIPFLIQNGGSTDKYELIPPKIATFGAEAETSMC